VFNVLPNSARRSTAEEAGLLAEIRPQFGHMWLDEHQYIF